jgi:hypothetical protein
MDFRLILGFWNLKLCLQVVKRGLDIIWDFFGNFRIPVSGSRHGGEATGVRPAWWFIAGFWIYEEHLNVFLSQLER